MKSKRLKSSLYCILMLLAAAAAGLAYGQAVPVNTLNTYSGMDGCDSTIVRCKDSLVIVCSHYTGDTVSHRFTVRNASASQLRQMCLPLFSTPDGSAADRVLDMRVLDTMCYFCGTRLVYSSEVPPLPIDAPGSRSCSSYGFMGYFSIPAVLRGQGCCHFRTVDGLKTAARLAVYPLPEAGRTGICILGTKNGDSTCLAELANSASAHDTWGCRIGRPAQPDEVLTDVAATSHALVAASVFANDSTLVGFRQAKLDEYGFCNPNSALGASSERFDYDIRSIICHGENYFPNGIWRYAGRPVLLCPDGDKFIAGFSGSQFWYSTPSGPEFNPNGHSILMHMESPARMLEVQALQNGRNAWLKEIVSVKEGSAAAVLAGSLYHWYPGPVDSTYSVLQFVQWGAADTCRTYFDTMLRKDGGMLHSIDKFGENQAAASGCCWYGRRPFDAVQYQFRCSNSCLAELHASPCELGIQVLKPASAEYINNRWKTENHPSENWTAFSFVSKKVPSATCSH